MSIALRGSVACVTGAARGIGRATACALAAKGARVVLGDLDLEPLEALAAELGYGAVALRLDVADARSFAAFVEAARGLGPIDLLVNNAGIQRTGAFVDQDLDLQAREIAINLGGVVNGMRLVLPEMLLRNRGHVVNVASMAGKMTVPGAAVYSATKAAVASLSRAVRSEIAATNVTVTTILPSAVETELTAGLDVRGVPKAKPSEVAAAIVDSCDHGRPEVTLPRWVAPVGAVEQLVPERLGEFVKRAVGAQRRITATNAATRAYQSRTSRS